jgi:hypothetical protein
MCAPKSMWEKEGKGSPPSSACGSVGFKLMEALCDGNVGCTATAIPFMHFWELRGLSPNFHINVSVSDLYIPWIGPHIPSTRKGRSIVGIYSSHTDTRIWKLGLRPRYSFSGNICFKFSAFCLCSVGWKYNCVRG